LKLGDLKLEKLDHILSRALLSLKGSGELECRFKLTGEGFGAVDDVLWDVGSWLLLVVIVVLKLHQRWFRGSWSTNHCCSAWVTA